MSSRDDHLPSRFAVRHVLLPDALVAARRNQNWCDVARYIPPILAAGAYERCLFRDRAAQVEINAMMDYIEAPSAEAAPIDAKKMLPRTWTSIAMEEWHSNMIGICMRQGLVPNLSRESSLTGCNWTPEMMTEMRRYRAAVRSAGRVPLD